MITLNIDDDTAAMLKKLSERKHISPDQLIHNILTEYLEDRANAAAADAELAELERGEDSVISRVEWEQQLDAIDHYT
jgi:predicted transcriptional regulator